MTEYESIKLGVYDQMKAELDQLRAENERFKNELSEIARIGNESLPRLDALLSENLALALQVKYQREFLEFAWRDIPMNEYAFEKLEKTLSQSDNSAEIIATHDAEVRKAALLEAAEYALKHAAPCMAEYGGDSLRGFSNELRCMAGEVKG